MLLDFDEGWRAPNFRGMLSVLRTLGVVPTLCEYHRTRKGWHVWFRVKSRLSPLQTVAIQFAAGSDRKRETLNLMRVLSLHNAPTFWRKRWNILFEDKLR